MGTHSPNDTTQVVEGHGGTVTEDPRLKLLGKTRYAAWMVSERDQLGAGQGHSRGIRNDQSDKEERHEPRPDDGDRELCGEAKSRHSQEDGKGPEEESARIGVVGAKVHFERQVDHRVEERHDEVEREGDDDTEDEVRSSR